MTWANLVLLVTLGAIWGASFLFIKIGLQEIGPMTLASARVVVGTIALLVVVRLKGYRLPGWSTWRRVALMGFLGILLPFGAITWGTQFIPSGLAAILNATMPLFTYILSLISGEETPGARRILGLIVGFTGILILTSPQWSGGLQTHLLGELAIIAASICYAFSLTYARHRLKDQPPLLISLGQVSTGALFFLPLTLSERPWTFSFSPITIWAILGLGVLGTAVSYIIYYRLLRDAGTTWTSLVTYIVPFFGIFWGWVILDERLSWHAFVALGTILAGLLLISNLWGKKQKLTR